MPLYEYECGRCGRFEKIRSFSDPPLDACPTCQGAIERLASAPAIQFKGSGWYVTDYARKGAPGDAGAKAASPAASEAKGSKEGASSPGSGAASSTGSGGSGTGSSGSASGS